MTNSDSAACQSWSDSMYWSVCPKQIYKLKLSMLIISNLVFMNQDIG